MKKLTKVLLLKIIKGKGDISLLAKEGYEYSQILEFIKDLIKDGYFVKHGKELLITNKGLEEINALNKELDRKNIEKWIEPEQRSKISQIDKNDIFLPNQNELFFG